MDDPQVRCVIPTFDRPSQLATTLRCLERQQGVQIQAYVVDHSKDGSARSTVSEFGFCQYMPASDRLWWAGAANHGLRAALRDSPGDDHVMLLNDDTEFGPGLVARLVAVSMSNGGAMVSAAVAAPGKPLRLTWAGTEVDFLRCRVTNVAPDEAAETSVGGVVASDSLIGRATVMPADLLARIGLLRARWLPHHRADSELSLRAKRNGARLLVVVDHPVETDAHTSGGAERHPFDGFWDRRRPNIRDMVVFFSITGPWWLRVWALPRVIGAWFLPWLIPRRAHIVPDDKPTR